MRAHKRIAALPHRFLDLFRTDIGITIGLAIGVGIVSGLGAIAFRYLIREIQRLFFGGGGEVLGFLGPYYVVILPAVGGLLIGLLIYFLAHEAKGHGVPEVMTAVVAQGGRIRSRVAGVKMLASAICIGSGGSVGREGPIVQIGASFGSTLGQRLKLSEDWVRTLVACGAAGGISATFNAPIAGAFFALEIILGRFIGLSFIPIVLSSVVANIISRAIFGGAPAFPLAFQYELVSGWEIPFYALLGLIAGIIGFVFIRSLYKCEDIFNNWKFPDYLKPLFGGLIIGLIGLYSRDLFGVGYGGPEYHGMPIYGSANYGAVEKALGGEIGLGEPLFTILLMLLVMLALKLIASSVTLGSGGSGGVFSPSLFMGVMVGGAFGYVIHEFFPTITASSGAYALVGMGAVFAGAARAPITSIIILFEMTRDYMLILPLMTAVVISTLLARRLSRETIYTAKVRRLGIELRPMRERNVMRTIRVEEAMTRNFPTVPSTMSVQDLSHELKKSGHHGFPVVDNEGRLVGSVTLTDIENAMGKGGTELTVNDICTKNIIVIYPDQSIYDALARLRGQDIGRIPVVDRNDRTKLLGILTRHDITKAYISKMAKPPPPEV